MVEALLVILTVLTAAALALLVMLLRRPAPQPDLDPILARINELQDRANQLLRDETARVQTVNAAAAKDLREEVSRTLATSFRDFTARLDALTIANNDAAAKLRADLNQSAATLRDGVTVQVQAFSDAGVKSVAALATQIHARFETFAAQLTKLTDSNEQRLDRLRATVDERLTQLQTDNAAKLEQMRLTVDEKLQSTLDKRLGESFKQVSDRLEQVHKGLGEMQSLSAGVTDLKRVMTNVKSRGTWAEYQLHNLLQDILSPDQYQANFRPRERSQSVVEFAVKLPGKDEDGRDSPCWLPIDSKFPREDYERLTAAAEAADVEGVDAAGKAMEARVKQCARDIRDKYIAPPRTTEWALMFLPTEGLYAEVLRRPALVEELRRECNVAVAGPTTLAAYLNALQMGFRSLAVQKKSAEIGKLLVQVKTQFGAFAGNLAAVQTKLDEASKKLGDARSTSDKIVRSLDKVADLPGPEGQPPLPLAAIAEPPVFGS